MQCPIVLFINLAIKRLNEHRNSDAQVWLRAALRANEKRINGEDIFKSYEWQVNYLKGLL